MVYIDVVDITKKDFDRINQLFDVKFDMEFDVELDAELDVEFDDESEKMQELIDKVDARKNTVPYTFMWYFEDGTYISMDMYVTDSNVYSIWSRMTENGKELLRFEFKLDEETVFTDIGKDKNTYICRFNIGE